MEYGENFRFTELGKYGVFLNWRQIELLESSNVQLFEFF